MTAVIVAFIVINTALFLCISHNQQLDSRD